MTITRSSNGQRRASQWATVLALVALLPACGGAGDGGAEGAEAPAPRDSAEATVGAGNDATGAADTTACQDELEAPTTFQVGHVLATSEPIHQELVAVGERLSEATGGGITLEVFPNSELGGNRDVAEQAILGAPVIGHLDPSYASEHGVPDMGVLTGPFLFEDVEQIDRMLDSDLMQQWRDQMREESNLESLAWNWYFGERHIISDSAYEEPESIRNVKIRVPPAPSWIETFEALGATPVTLEWSEVYTGLSQGVVDAAEAPLSTLQGSALYEVSDTVTLTSHFKAITGFAMNGDLYDQLPAACQELVRQEFVAGGERVTEATLLAQEETRGTLEGEGVEFVEADIPAYKEASASFYDQYGETYDQVLQIING